MVDGSKERRARQQLHQLMANDFSEVVARNATREPNAAAKPLLVHHSLVDETDDLLGRRRLTDPDDDEGGGQLAVDVVRSADDAGVLDGRMSQQVLLVVGGHHLEAQRWVNLQMESALNKFLTWAIRYLMSS